MSDNYKLKAGYWAIATQKHLQEFKTYSPNLNKFDTLNIAGKTGRLLGVIRGNGKIENMLKLEAMANTVGISPSELNLIVLPKLEKDSDKQVELIRDSDGTITGVSEYVFDNRSVLEIAGQVFENSNPSEIQRISIETMDETKKVPYLQNELTELLCEKGFNEKNIISALTFQEQFKLVQKLNKTKNPIISNEYVWGPNNKKIAMAFGNIDFCKKQNLKNVIEIIRNNQGYPIDKLPNIDTDLMFLAKKTGMINPITIVSSRGFDKDFAFCPNMLEPLTYNDDILDDVKLLLASIRFGENYTNYSKINDSIKFLESLIKYGDIGPHDANSTDYTLLEKKGIVRVVNTTKSRWSIYSNGYVQKKGYYLQLIRKDVAKEALKILKSPEYNIKSDVEICSYESVVDTGTFITAEENRIHLAESPEHVQEAEDYLCRALRDENI